MTYLKPVGELRTEYSVRIQGVTTDFGGDFEAAIRFWDSHESHRDGDVLEYLTSDEEDVRWAAGNLIHVGYGKVYVNPRLKMEV